MDARCYKRRYRASIKQGKLAHSVFKRWMGFDLISKYRGWREFRGVRGLKAHVHGENEFENESGGLKINVLKIADELKWRNAMKWGGFLRFGRGMRYAFELLNHNHTSESVEHEIEISTKQDLSIFLGMNVHVNLLPIISQWNDKKEL